MGAQKLQRGSDGKIRRSSDGKLLKQDATTASDCCCVATGSQCYVRWRYRFRCEEDYELEAIAIGCHATPPEYAGAWTKIQDRPRCEWLYDQLLEDDCTVEGECQDPPEEPDISLPSDPACCCYACLYTWEVVATFGVFGSVTQVSATCTHGDDVEEMPFDEWYLYEYDDTFCTYRYHSIGECCSEGDDEFCGEGWPSAPAPPTDNSECETCQEFEPIWLVSLTGASGNCIQLAGPGTEIMGDDASGSWLCDPSHETAPDAWEFPEGPTPDIKPYDEGCVNVDGAREPFFDPVLTSMFVGSYSGVVPPGHHGFRVAITAESATNGYVVFYGQVLVPFGDCCTYPRFVVISESNLINPTSDPFTGGVVTLTLMNCPLDE